jgi:cell surface protein SprA
MASTPSRFRESDLVGDLNYGVNRALLNWYVVNDRRIRTREDQEDPYTRLIDQTELFERQVDVSQIPDLLTFDMSYYPDERGPYNFDLPQGTPFSAGIDYDQNEERIVLKNPASRWGGIMRYIDSNNDFEFANYEYIEFWMMNPFMNIPERDRLHLPNETGFIFFNLGNVSEDVLKDNLQFYENSIPIPGETIPVQTTAWGEIPLAIPNINAFDRTNSAIQDLGFDGLEDDKEALQFSQYINAVENTFPLADVSSDPSNDNFISYLNDEAFQDENNMLNRFKRFNHPQDNVSDQGQRIGVGNPIPDTEDLNGNRSLEQSESYYEYVLPIVNDGGEVRRSPTDYITDERVILNPTTGEQEKWYRYRIPINEGVSVNGIQGLRSIQFIRVYMTGFQTPKTFRLAEFELVRNQWRRLPIDPECLGDSPLGSIDFVIDEVGIQENSNKQPFNYVLPKGIKQERLFSTFSNILQDENAINLRVCGIPDSCEAMISKFTQLDIRLFERMQMFVHAESKQDMLEDGDMSVFIRFGRDFRNNYYEYEVPLTLSDSNVIKTIDKTTNLQAYSDEVWRPENKMDFALSLFTDVKKERNASNVAPTDIYTLAEGDPENPRARVKIKGNPTLGYIKGMVIGVRNNSGGSETVCAEVWVNELRLQGLNDRGGVAGIARVDMQLADLGNITMSGNFNTVGWGQIDQQLQERSLDKYVEYDIATNLELGKFFPDKWQLSVPFYAQYAKSLRKPEYDAYELDLKVEELLDNPNLTPEERQDIEERSKEVTSIRTFNFTNVRKQRTSEGAPKPWDISNVSASYSFTRTKYSNDILKSDISDDQRGELNYSYTRRAEPIQPFKGIKSDLLRFVREINFNPLPNGFSFNTQLRRFQNQKIYRLPNPQTDGIVYAFDDKRFNWTRNYSLQWDLTKSLKVNYDATAQAVVDELRQVGVAPTTDERNWEDPFGIDVTDQVSLDPNLPGSYRRENLKEFGRLKNYNQGLSINYTLPFRYIPGLDWISARAQYNSDYIWTAGSLSLNGLLEPGIRDIEGPWHTIQNNQSRSINATLSFDKLYDKIGYLKRLNGPNRGGNTRSTRGRSQDNQNTQEGSRRSRQNQGREPSSVERLLLRPLFALKEIRLTYREDLSTVVPGFKLTPKFLGITEGAPGWGFVFGLQPDISLDNPNNWLAEADRNQWITPTRFQNQQVLQSVSQNYQARIQLEPWEDFDIDINFNKRYTENHAEDFINVGTAEDPNFQQRALRDVGSYEVTFFTLGTLFGTNINDLFDVFEGYRSTISNHLPNDPNAAGEPHSQDAGFSKGFGRQHVDVIVPAFLAAYTGKDPSQVALDLTDQVAGRGYIPKPNWQLRYSGLSKLPWFRDVFSSFSVTHGYTNTLGVNQFATDLQYSANDPYFIDPDISTGNYFARFEIPELVISERFQPIIGIDLKTQNNLTINFEYAKSRNLQLSTGLGQLTEGKSTEFTGVLGWTFDNVNIGFLTGNRRSRSRRSRTADDDLDPPADDQANQAENFQKKLELNFNFSLRDDATFIHDLDSGGDSDATRGTYSLQISPQVDYDINKHFTLRAFVNYSRTEPKTEGGFDVTNIQGGITARFNLN